MTLRWPGLCLGLLLVAAGVSLPALGQDTGAPAWRDTWSFLVQDVCLDASGVPNPRVTPLDGTVACPRQRDLRPGEPLPYHKQDWSGLPDRQARPDGYQRSDSFPALTAFGPAVVQTYDFGDSPRAFGSFDPGDGGQVAFFSNATASFGLTEDGGAGLQFFLGPDCRPEDGWVLVDGTFPARSSGQLVARLTRAASRCPGRLGYAFTRWEVRPVEYRARVHDRDTSVELVTLIAEHFGSAAVQGADHLERMYFTRELGYTRWERWQNLTRHDRSRDRRLAGQLAASDRCRPGLGAPSSAEDWVMIDCREWTTLVPAAQPGGDAPEFWLERLRRYPETHAVFAP